MHSIHGTPKNLIVVDPRPQDYRKLLSGMPSPSAPCYLFTNGRDALRCSGLPEESLWLINTQLPDMRGTNLMELLRMRPRTAQTTVCLVCDHYSQQEEKDARAAGPAAFFCKPPDSSWLHNRYYETRAGPTTSVPEPQTQEKEHPSYSFSNHGPTNLESI